MPASKKRNNQDHRICFFSTPEKRILLFQPIQYFSFEAAPNGLKDVQRAQRSQWR